MKTFIMTEEIQLKLLKMCTTLPPFFTDDIRGNVIVRSRKLKDKVCPNQEDPSSKALDPKILDLWADRHRAFWVVQPGKDAYFLHNIHKNYSVQIVENYNPTYKHKERVFYRPFLYEFECMEEARLDKLRLKMEMEEANAKKVTQDKVIEEQSRAAEPCALDAPFWVPKVEKRVVRKSQTVDRGPKGGQDYEEVCKRWHEVPNCLDSAGKDYCRRRLEMAMVGQLFQSEACNWYYENYPPPPPLRSMKKFS